MENATSSFSSYWNKEAILYPNVVKIEDNYNVMLLGKQLHHMEKNYKVILYRHETFTKRHTLHLLLLPPTNTNMQCQFTKITSNLHTQDSSFFLQMDYSGCIYELDRRYSDDDTKYKTFTIEYRKEKRLCICLKPANIETSVLSMFSPWFNEYTEDDGNGKGQDEEEDTDTTASSLIHFAESERMVNNWSSWEFILNPDMISKCAKLVQSRLPPYDEYICSILGNKKFQLYGVEVINIMTRISISNTKKASDREIYVLENTPMPYCIYSKQIFDRFHRRGIIESNPMHQCDRIVCAPAGGGKSTLLLDIVKNWESVRFCLITFSKDLCGEMEVRVNTQSLQNVRVYTMDALCKRANEDDSQPFVVSFTDRAVVQNARPWSKYGCFKGSKGISDTITYALNSNLNLSEGVRCIPLCEEHKLSQKIVNDIIQCDQTKQTKHPLRNSFAGCRHRALMKQDGLGLAKNFDCILVDEVQDLTSQAIRILQQAALPIVFVGDPLQEIFSFGDDNTCAGCKTSINANSTTSYRTKILDHRNRISLYGTFRLCEKTCSTLRRWFHGSFKAVSMRPYSTPTSNDDGSKTGVQYVQRIPKDENLLLLCRTNKEVIDFSLEDPEMHIIQGDKIANELQCIHEQLPAANITKKRRWSALQRLVVSLRELGKLELTLTRLRDMSVQLDNCSEKRSICTVHRAKGFEIKNVVITESVYACMNSADKNVAFVAVSRHTQQLFIMQKSYGHAPLVLKRKRNSSK